MAPISLTAKMIKIESLLQENKIINKLTKKVCSSELRVCSGSRNHEMTVDARFVNLMSIIKRTPVNTNQHWTIYFLSLNRGYRFNHTHQE